MLNAKNLALSGAIVCSLSWFLFIVLVLLTDFGIGFINFMASSFFNAYQLNWWGALFVLIFSFIKTFILLFLFALIYNALNKKKQKPEINYENKEE